MASWVPSSSSGKNTTSASAANNLKDEAARAASKFSQTASKQADRAAKAVQEGTEKAAKAAQLKFQEVQEAARRKALQLDSEYQLGDKAERATRRAQEVARDIDQQFSLRRKLRSAVDTLRQRWPTWRRQLEEFSGTWYGKVALFTALFVVLSSTIFWKVMNVVLLLWWLSVPLSLMLVDAARKRQQEEAAAAAEAERLRQNPFAQMFRGAQAAAGGDRRASANRRSNNRSAYTQQEGPIIDAEWVPLDNKDDDSSSSSGKSSSSKRRSGWL